MKPGKLIAFILLIPIPAVFIVGLLSFSVSATLGRWIGIMIGIAWLQLWFALLFRRVVVVINEHGIEDRRTGMGLIEWEDIHAIEQQDGIEEPCLVLRVDDENKYIERQPRYRRWWDWLVQIRTGRDPFTIHFFSVKPHLSIVWEHILLYHRGDYSGYTREWESYTDFE